MWQVGFGRRALVVAGVLGLFAGAVAAQQMRSELAHAAGPQGGDPLPAPAQTTDAKRADALAEPPRSELVFLDSEPREAVSHADDQAGGAKAASGSGGVVRTAVVLFVLIGGAVAWLILRRRQSGPGASGDKAIALVGSVRVAGRWQVALVRVPGKTLVVGATDKGLSLLSELDEDVALESLPDEPRLADPARRQPEAAAPIISPRTVIDRVATDRGLGAPARTSRPTTAPPQESFSQLLDQLTRSGGAPAAPAQRDRLKTDEAIALRARLERHQAPN